MSKTNYLENLLLNAVFNAGSITGITPYVGLFTVAPTDSAAGTEVTTTIRAAGRPVVSMGAPVTAAGANTIANDAIVDFGASAGDPADLVAFGIFDAASAGNLLYYGPLTGAPVAVSLGSPVTFPIGSLVVTED